MEKLMVTKMCTYFCLIKKKSLIKKKENIKFFTFIPKFKKSRKKKKRKKTVVRKLYKFEFFFKIEKNWKRIWKFSKN